MQGQMVNFTFAQNGYVPSTGFTVNATVEQDFVTPGNAGLQLYCASGTGQATNGSAALPSQASAVGTISKCLFPDTACTPALTGGADT